MSPEIKTRNLLIVEDAKTLRTAEIAKKYNISQRQVQIILKKQNVKSTCRKAGMDYSENLFESWIYEIKYRQFSYIGQTNNLKVRMNTHLYDLKNQKHTCYCLQKLYNFDPVGVEEAIKNCLIVKNFKNISRGKLTEAEHNAMVEIGRAGQFVINSEFINEAFANFMLLELEKTKFCPDCGAKMDM